MKRLQFVNENFAVNVMYTVDELSMESNMQVFDIVGLNDLESKFGFIRFRQLTYTLKEFKDFATQNNLSLKLLDSNSSEELVTLTPLDFTTVDTTTETEEVQFSFDIEVEGGTGEITFSLGEGDTLPSGVTLEQVGSKYVLSGTPADSSAGEYVLNITATDLFGTSVTQEFTLEIIAGE